ncbi:MAG: hypothetical protein Aurels2KO_47720 [Aureliella sp.]
MTTEAAEKAPRKRARRTLESGYSLLSRGEPQIWLIGGMLVVCLLMITALLSLILYRGLPAFWPRQVDWMVLDDGSQEIGQPQYRQAGLTGGQDKDEENEAEVKVAIEAAISDEYSSYYRTGNYRLSGVHYRWIDSTQLDDTAISTPKDAVVVERLSWGRFYGIPVQILQQILPSEEAQAEIDRLQKVVEVLEVASGSESADSEQITAAIDAVNAARNSVFADALGAEIDSRRAALQPGDRIQVQSIEDGPWEAWSPEAPEIVAARIVSENQSDFAAEMESQLQRAITLRDEADALRLEVSHLDGEIAKFRIAVRQAELDTQTDALVQADASHYAAEQLATLERLVSVAKDADGWLSEALTRAPDLDQESISAVGDALKESADSLLPSLIEQQESALDEWLAGSQDQPAAIGEALARYAAGYRETIVAKQPLEEQIEGLHRLASRDSFVFCVPNSSTQLAEIPQDDLAQLSTGVVSETAASALSTGGITLADDPNIVAEELSDRLTMVRMTDSNGRRSALSVVEASYINGPSTLQLHQLTLEQLPAEEIVRLVRVNELSFGGKVGVYLDRWSEFLLDEPREANSEGGVFPAIWGTIVMTLIMTIAVVPFGVMAALYLREYAGGGPLVSLIRISINNLAGVPSIVYGVFGFSFFCYTIGAYIDGGPKNADIAPWPSGTWFVWLAACAIVGTGAFFASFLASGTTGNASAGKKMISRVSMVLWLTSLAIFAALILKSPFFDGFYQAQLPNPTFGKGGLLWAALTLALLTLPVVIVATEEALAAVPNSLREGSLACGASKWQTIRRIILPHARPGILTGAILAMARGAGEVAPLMLVGALPSAPDLPLDGKFPFFHGSRSFMHLGYQIYTLGFQSQNSDAAVPMVFTCTLLLIAIVAALNVFAILLRARLKKRFEGNQF